MNFSRCLEKLLNDYLEVDKNPGNYPPPYVASKVPVVIQALKGFHQLHDNQVIPVFFLNNFLLIVETYPCSFVVFETYWTFLWSVIGLGVSC